MRWLQHRQRDLGELLSARANVGQVPHLMTMEPASGAQAALADGTGSYSQQLRWRHLRSALDARQLPRRRRNTAGYESTRSVVYPLEGVIDHDVLVRRGWAQLVHTPHACHGDSLADELVERAGRGQLLLLLRPCRRSRKGRRWFNLHLEVLLPRRSIVVLARIGGSS